MKLSVYIIIVVGTLFCSTEYVHSQQLSDEVQSMLSESDQKKIAKADETYTKGDLILSKASYPGDDNLINSSDPESKLNKKYFSKRIEATDYYKVANSSKLAVYDNNIKNFWKKFKGDHQTMELVKQAEIKAFMQFQEAQQNRKDASRNPKMKDWLPLILKAEEGEKQALIQLQKVLFVYLSYPAQYNQAWFTADTATFQKSAPEVKSDTKPEAANAELPVAVAQPTAQNIASADTVKSVNTQQQQVTMPATPVKIDEMKTEADISNKEGLSRNNIEKSSISKPEPSNIKATENVSVPTIRKEGAIESKDNPSVANAVVNEESLPANIQPQDIRFHIQIAASRDELSSEVLNGIYNGNTKIVSIVEDGWFKYSVIAGNTLEDALALLKNIDVPGAFVVAYVNNQKMNLLSAIRLTR